MKTKLKNDYRHLFLEKRLAYDGPPEKPEKQTEAVRSPQELMKGIETAVKNLEQGKGERFALLTRIEALLTNSPWCDYFSPELLTSLAQRKDIREAVMLNPHTPVTILAKYANDSDKGVRERIAMNPKTPGAVLAKLATDADLETRLRVVDNPNLPLNVLIKLAGDAHEYVRWEVARQAKTPSGILAKLANDTDAHVRGWVAANPKTLPDVLAKLAQDKAWDVRLEVARNPKTPPAALAKLANDTDPNDLLGRVSTDAKHNPNYPKNEKK